MTISKPLKVLHLIESFGTDLYGVATVVSQLVENLQPGVTWRVGSGVLQDIPERQRANVESLPFGTRPLNYWSPGQARKIAEVIRDFKPDLIHVHGVFSALQRNAVRGAQEMGVPVLLSAHGMLAPWLWNQKGASYRYIKMAFWRLVIEPVLSQVEYLHAITVLESATIEAHFRKPPQFVIPNALDLTAPEFVRVGSQRPQPYLLFLGRIHPVKGLSILLRAYALSEARHHFRMLVAGPVWDARYRSKLDEQVRRHGLDGKVDFLEPVHGTRKIDLLQNAWVLVLPSFSEVIGMVNLEAAACFTPSLTTRNTGLMDWEEGGGLLVDPDFEDLADALDGIAAWSPAERLVRGKRSRKLVEQRYSWGVVKHQWMRAYERIAQERGHAQQ